MHKSSQSHFLIFSVDQKSSKFSCASSSNFPMFIASTPAVRVVLDMGGTPMIHVIDPFSSGQRAMGWGWLGYAEQVKCQTRFRQEKIYPKFYFIFIFFITKNNMIVIKNSLFIILFLPFLGGLSYRKSLVSPGFSAGRAPFRQLRRFCRFSPQVRRLGSQLAAEGSAPRRAAAFWAQLLQQLSWGSMILGVWLYHHEKTMGIGSLFQNLDV